MNTNMERTLDVALTTYHDIRFPYDPRRAKVWNVLAGYLQQWVDPKGGLLEMGAGYGEFSREIAAGQKWALDMNPELVRYWGEDVRPLIQSALEPLPIASGSLSTVFASNFFEHFTIEEGTAILNEAKRVLRPGGRLVFNHSSPFHFLCWDDRRDRVGERLARDYFGMRKWDHDSVDFMLPYGEWIRVFRRNGLDVEDLIELRPSARARTTYGFYAPLAWARQIGRPHV